MMSLHALSRLATARLVTARRGLSGVALLLAMLSIGLAPASAHSASSAPGVSAGSTAVDSSKVLVVTLDDGGTARFGGAIMYGYVELYLDAGTRLVLPDGGAPYPTVRTTDAYTVYEGHFTLHLTPPGAAPRDLVVENGTVTAYDSVEAARESGALRSR